MKSLNKHRVIVTAVWALMLIISMAYIKHNLSVVSDMQQFMPTDSSDKRLQVLMHETQRGLASNLILLQVGGATPDDLAKLSKNIKNSLEGNHDLFKFVVNGEQSLDIKSFGSLIDYRHLLRHPGSFSAETLRKSFEGMLSTLRGGASGEIVKYLLLDPQRSFAKYLLAQSGQAQPEKLNGVWFVSDKSKALLMIQLNSTGFNLDFQEAGINEIKSVVTALDESGQLEMVLSGPAVIAVATRESIRGTTLHVSLALSVVVIVLLWFGYRSIRVAFIAGIPLITSIIVTIAITQMIFGELHGIVLAFGITMLGVCIDYPLHLFSHINKNETPGSTLKRIWPTLRLGVLSSVLAYLALLGTGFSGLTQLAVFSAVGLVVALAVTRLLIPLWVSATWIDKRSVIVLRPVAVKIKLILSIAVIGTSLYILSAEDNIWSNDITQISPVSASMRDTDRQLRRQLHAPDVSHMFLLEADTSNSALEETEKVKFFIEEAIKKGYISGMQSATDILPDDERQKYYQSLLPETMTLRENVISASRGLGFKDNAFDGFIDGVELSKSRSPIGYDAIISSPLGSKLQSFLFEQDAKWYSIIRLSGISNEKAFNSWLKASPNIEPYYISMRGATNVLMNSYLESAWARLLLALSLIVLIVLFQASKRKEAIWILVPIVAGVTVSLAVQVLLGNLINLFHILSLLLVMGMGLDYSLFFNREWKHEKQLQDRTHAILISAITTIIAFSTLGFSDVPILSAMGQTVSVGILVCFILAQSIATPRRKPRGE